MKKLLYPFLILIFLAVAGVTFLMIAAPTELIRNQLISLVKEKTGRELIIRGDTSFSVFPTLGVEINDVSLSGPASNPQRLLLKMDTLTAKVSLLPLIQKKIEVNSFVLTSPVFDLWVDTNGGASWEFASRQNRAHRRANVHPSGARLIRIADKKLPAELDDFVKNSGANTASIKSAEQLEGLFKDLRLEQVEIKNGKLRYEDQRSGARQALDDIDLALELDALENPLDAKGGLVWQKERVNFDGQLASPKNVLLGHASDLTLDITGKPLSAKFDGSVAAGDGFTANGNLALRTPEIDGLLNWISPGSSGPLGGAATIETTLATGQNQTEFKKIKFALRGASGDGNITLATGGARPNVTGDLHLTVLDLTKLLSGGNGAAGHIPISRGAFGLTASSAKSDIRGMQRFAQASGKASGTATQGWSKAKIDVAALNLLDAQVVLTVDAMNHGKVKMTNGRLVTLLKHGILRVNVEKISLYGGRGTGRISVDGGRGPAQVSASMLINSVSALPLLKDAAEFDWIDGRGQIALNVTGRGASQDAIVRSLSGDGRVTFSDGALVGINIPKLVRSFQSGQMTGFTKTASEKTDFSELSGTFKIADGVATNPDLRMVGPLLRMSGDGRINIPTKSVDYSIKPKLVASLDGQGGQGGNGELEGIEVPILVRGPWTSPAITPDLQSMLTNSDETIKSAKKIFKGLKKKFDGGDVEGVLKGLFGGQ